MSELGTISLSPAAGAGIGKLWADALMQDPALLAEEMVGVVKRAFRAKRKMWDVAAKEYFDEDDCKTQLAALTLVLANLEGEPIKRIVHQHLGTGQIDPVAAMQESPALVAAMERALENAKFRTRRGKRAAPAETLDLA